MLQQLPHRIDADRMTTPAVLVFDCDGHLVAVLPLASACHEVYARTRPVRLDEVEPLGRQQWSENPGEHVYRLRFRDDAVLPAKPLEIFCKFVEIRHRLGHLTYVSPDMEMAGHDLTKKRVPAASPNSNLFVCRDFGNAKLSPPLI
jgi:hypothetical protein